MVFVKWENNKNTQIIISSKAYCPGVVRRVEALALLAWSIGLHCNINAWSTATRYQLKSAYMSGEQRGFGPYKCFKGNAAHGTKLHNLPWWIFAKDWICMFLQYEKKKKVKMYLCLVLWLWVQCSSSTVRAIIQHFNKWAHSLDWPEVHVSHIYPSVC